MGVKIDGQCVGRSQRPLQSTRQRLERTRGNCTPRRHLEAIGGGWRAIDVTVSGPMTGAEWLAAVGQLTAIGACSVAVQEGAASVDVSAALGIPPSHPTPSLCRGRGSTLQQGHPLA